ncbi:DHA2 family efflux MFS transporter permease subunit [Agromyces aurantiacus]|uniref:DHA2 family efflux MFS transporter permease subunit n=1 Tax=Agromyces aurantiacus TaxID=165814 RepID=A0ABV9R2I6_9MICO|nr:MFS transporter [Agromyces aurantiacus]MBM7503023.1 EmrB/QacA subfamily drug resistance transporter [Agromyces aurantiacus]
MKRERWAGLVVISVAVALIIVDSTIVNVAIPAIVDDLGITSTQVQWVQESYTLVFAAFLLLFGALADRYGRRAVLLTGVVVFAASSVVAAFADSGTALIAARLVQGLGGAAILPTTLSLINATFRGRERGIAFAIWGSTIGGMAAVGPLLGGWLTTEFSWRWAFGINVPLGILIVIGVLVFVAESRAERPQPIDWAGALISVIASGSIVFALIEGRTYGWWFTEEAPSIGDWTWPYEISPIPFAFAIGIAFVALFVVRAITRTRAGRPVLLSPDLFGIRSFRNGNIAAAIVSLGEFGIILALPLWLQNALGYTALQTGWVLVALAGGSFVASGFASATIARFAPVTIVRAGLVAEIVGLVITGLVISVDTPWWAIVIGLFVYGFGVGLATAQLTNVVLREVPVARSGEASGTQSTSRQLGSALGIAILGTLLFSTLEADLRTQLGDAPGADQVVSAVVDSAGAAIPAIEQQSPEAADAARESLSTATAYSAYAAAGFLGLGLLATLGLGSGRREEDAAPAAAPEAPIASEGERRD